jgi:anti-sigma factor RsiW
MRSPIPSAECARARDWASLRLDDQLSDFEEVLLEGHLARCDDCRAFAASISDLTAALRSAPLEQPAFAFEPPHRTRGRMVALRAVSAAAAVAVLGVSGLVSLQLSASRARPGATAIERKVIGLKERQMNELNGGTTRHTEVRHSLAAVERIIVGMPPSATSRVVLREGLRPVTRTTSEGR